MPRLPLLRHRNRRFRHGAAALVLLAGCASDGGEAGDPTAPRSLGEPVDVFPEDFALVQTVRETPDGTLLIADPLAQALYRVDLGAGTREVVGSQGSGPEEYRQPDAVWPLPGDSTLLVDLGNARLVALGPDLSFGPTTPITLGEPGFGRSFVVAVPQGVDRDGRIYATRRVPTAPGEDPADSSSVVRIDRASMDVDSVAATKVPDVRLNEMGAGRISIAPIPLSPEDAWGVAADGTVVIARSNPYRVDRVAPDGSVTAGPTIAYEPLPIGQEVKEEWLAARSRTPGLSMSISLGAGGGSTSMSRGGFGGASPRADAAQYEWPDVAPPFHAGRLPVDPSDRAWVRRHVPPGEPPTYDVFDAGGERVLVVRLDASLGSRVDRRVVGFGADAVYVVAFDQFDLNYLERYELPR